MYTYHKTVLISLIISLNMMAMNTQEIIPSASYAAPADQDDITGNRTSANTSITFYTFDGNPITTMPLPAGRTITDNQLDKSAPKPQPVSCAIKYWPAFRAPVGGLLGLFIPTITKGVPGDFIVFYDKNEKIVQSYRYNRATSLITVFHEQTQTYQAQTTEDLRQLKDFPLDLSKVTLKNNEQ
jgi:hypothetical protein